VADQGEGELDVARMAAGLRRRWYVVLLVVGATMAAAWWFESRKVEEFVARAGVHLEVEAAQEALTAIGLGRFVPAPAAELGLAQSDEILEEVSAELGQQPDGEVSLGDDGSVLWFTARANSPEKAAEHANAWANTYLERKRSETRQGIEAAMAGLQARIDRLKVTRAEVRSPIDELETQINELALEQGALIWEAGGTPTFQQLFAIELLSAQRSQLEIERNRLQATLSADIALIDAEIRQLSDGYTQLDLRTDLAGLGTARLTQAAQPDPDPVNDTLVRSLVTAGLLGVFLGVAAVIGLEATDRRIRTSAQAARAARVPVLVCIPRARRRARSRDLAQAEVKGRHVAVADGYQRLRSTLRSIRRTQPIRSVLVTSATPGDGKSTTASNLAWTWASLDVEREVVLVDADLSRPRQHEMAQVSQGPGLTDLIAIIVSGASHGSRGRPLATETT
jgi:uncharacterized protein involved in exopolysaccharide biosynthesis